MQRCPPKTFSGLAAGSCTPCPVLNNLETNMTLPSICSSEGVLQKDDIVNRTDGFGVWWSVTNIPRPGANESGASLYLCNLPTSQKGDCIVVLENASDNSSSNATALGGLVPQCGNHKTGRLCQRCKAGLTKVFKSCFNCGEWVAVSVLVCIGIVMVAVAGFEYLLRPVSSADIVNDKAPTRSAFLQVVFDFVQMVGLLESIRFQWPQAVVGVFTVARSGTGFGILSVFCAVSLEYHQMLLFASLSLTVALVALVAHLCLKFLVLRCVLRRTALPLSEWIWRHQLNRALPSAVKNIFTLMSPSIAQICLRHFQCVRIDGMDWIKADVEQPCDEFSGWSVAAILGILQVAVPPVLMLRTLSKASTRAMGMEREYFPEPRTRLKRLFDDDLSQWNVGVRREAWPFEPILLIRKIGFASATTIVSAPTTQTYVATLILCGTVLLTACMRPYREGWLNAFACCGQTVAIMCVLTAWAFCGPTTAGAAGSSQSDDATLAATVIITILVVGWGAVLLAQGVRLGYSAVVAMPRQRNSDSESVGGGLNELRGPLLPPGPRSEDGDAPSSSPASADAADVSIQVNQNVAREDGGQGQGWSAWDDDDDEEEVEREQLVELELRDD